MPINSPTGFLDITNATLRTSNLEAENLLITGGNIYVTSELEADATVLNLENVTRKGNVSSNTIEITNATTGIVATGNIHALEFIGSGAGLTSIPSSAISGTLSQWSDGANNDVYIASNVGIGNVHTLTSNTLQVGGNLYVRDTDANVLTVNGNVVASYFEGDGSKLSGIVTDLQGVTDNGNVTTNVVQFSNVTTGLVTTANIEVGGDIKVVGLTAGTVPYIASDKFLKDSFITMTGDTTVITSNLDVSGNIFMRGKKFIVESETKLIKDAIIGIANNNASSTTDKGIIIQNDPSNANGNIAIIHHGTGSGFADQLTFGYTADPLDTVTVTNDLTKELTVNVLGNVITQNNLSIGGLLKINTISAASSHSLQAVTNLGNVTSNTVQFSNAITSLVASSNIVATGNVTAGYDTNTTSYFGKVAVGNDGRFAHISQNAPATYALKQTATGLTSINTPGPSGHIRFTVNDGDVGAEKMRITGAGNVGIGVSAPHANLHVAGNVYVSSNLTASGNVEASKFIGDGSLLTGITTIESNVDLTTNTDNTAFINLNSNVVVEFPRSKKLIKYPRVALTGDIDQGYTVTSTSENSTYSQYDWKTFDNNSTDFNYDNRWRTDDNRYTDNYTNKTGNPSSPTGSASEYLFTGSEPGDWIALELPEKMSLKTFRFSGPTLHTPYEGIIYGYDTTTTSWKYVGRFIYKTPRDVAWEFSDDTITQDSAWGANSTLTYRRDSKGEATYSPMYYTDNDLFFSKYAMIINKTNGHHAASLYSWELYGVPEYDPEVYGTDIIMRSVNNIPNTDWLVVYYDGQDYSSVENTITNKTGVTAQNATISNSGSTITFDSDYKAWKFGGDDTRTDTFIATLPSTFVGNQAHSASIWFRMDKFINTGNTGDDALFSISASGGEGTSHQALGVRFNTTFESGYQLLYYFWDNDVQISFPNNEIPSVKKWYHLVVTYDGEQRLAFIDGQYAPIYTTSGGGTYGKPLNLPASAQLQLGRRNNAANEFHGSIANFRLYNRPISEDEIWQLYAYQKELFNKEPNVITFKNGRLGVGTTEPRAVLDIRGDILVNGMRLQFLLDGSSPEKAAPSAVHLLNNNMRNSGFYWIRPEGYVTPTQIYCDLDGTVSGIGTGGWMRVEYANDRYTEASPLAGSTSGWSGLFTFVQDTDLIKAMTANATQVRQTLESWGKGSVGWTYSTAYMGMRTMGGFTATTGTGGTTAAAINLPPNTSMSFYGWNAQGALSLGLDPTDHNDNNVWDQSVAYFVENPTANGTFNLPITEAYARDVDNAAEKRYWPTKTGYNSYIWIK